MNIVLTGFMGSGKTRIASIIGKKLGLEVVEMDKLILEKSKLNSINQIFETRGEIVFRELELQVSKELSQKDNLIISTGGGVIMNMLNIEYLKKNSTNFYLHASFELIKNRIAHKNNRPLFKNVLKAKKLYKFREPLYRFYADKIIYIKKNPDKNKKLESLDAAQKILKYLNK